MTGEVYPVDRVIALLRLNQARGMFGTMEICWHGHNIVSIKQHETLKPHDLPPVVQPT